MEEEGGQQQRNTEYFKGAMEKNKARQGRACWVRVLRRGPREKVEGIEEQCWGSGSSRGEDCEVGHQEQTGGGAGGERRESGGPERGRTRSGGA